MCYNIYKHGSYVGEQRFYSDMQLPHEFVNGLCKDCEYRCQHNNTSHVENGEYWFTCSKCNMVTEKKAFPDLIADTPDRVCRTQDYVFSFTLPNGCTNPGFSWGFTLKGDGGEITPVDGVCTITVKSEWYDSNENSFTLEIGADIEGVHFSDTKTITIVDGHKGGTATCIEKAVCDICGESYGEPDKNNHVGGTELKGLKPATDTEEGYTGDVYCLGCGALLALGEIIPAENPAVPPEEPVVPSEEPIDPPEKSAAPSEKPVDNTDAPKTGDNSSITLWFALLLFSGAAIVKTAKAPKKKEK